MFPNEKFNIPIFARSVITSIILLLAIFLEIEKKKNSNLCFVVIPVKYSSRWFFLTHIWSALFVVLLSLVFSPPFFPDRFHCALDEEVSFFLSPPVVA